jgi:hypothetical protein
MKTFEEEKLKEALIKAYREKDDLEVPKLWAEQVMNHIRRLGPINKQSFLLQFQQLVWRFAPVACMLIVALVIYMIKVDFVPEYEIAEILMNDPVGFVLVEPAIT